METQEAYLIIDAKGQHRVSKAEAEAWALHNGALKNDITMTRYEAPKANNP